MVVEFTPLYLYTGWIACVAFIIIAALTTSVFVSWAMTWVYLPCWLFQSSSRLVDALQSCWNTQTRERLQIRIQEFSMRALAFVWHFCFCMGWIQMWVLGYTIRKKIIFLLSFSFLLRGLCALGRRRFEPPTPYFRRWRQIEVEHLFCIRQFGTFDINFNSNGSNCYNNDSNNVIQPKQLNNIKNKHENLELLEKQIILI